MLTCLWPTRPVSTRLDLWAHRIHFCVRSVPEHSVSSSSNGVPGSLLLWASAMWIHDFSSARLSEIMTSVAFQTTLPKDIWMCRGQSCASNGAGKPGCMISCLAHISVKPWMSIDWLGQKSITIASQIGRRKAQTSTISQVRTRRRAQTRMFCQIKTQRPQAMTNRRRTIRHRQIASLTHHH